MNTNKKSQKSHGQPDGWMEGRTDRHIILPLRVFDLVACGRMHYTQLRAVRFDCQKSTRRTGQRDIHISSTGPHWSSTDPSLGYKCIVIMEPHTGNSNSNSNHI